MLSILHDPAPPPMPCFRMDINASVETVSDLYIDWGAFSCLDYNILFSPVQTLYMVFVYQHGHIPSLWSTKYVHSFPLSCELLVSLFSVSLYLCHLFIFKLLCIMEIHIFTWIFTWIILADWYFYES